MIYLFFTLIAHYCVRENSARNIFAFSFTSSIFSYMKFIYI